MRITLPLLILIAACNAPNSPPPSDPIRPNQTHTYEEAMAWWDSLDQYSGLVHLQSYGRTDADLPLHLAILDPDFTDLRSLKESGKCILLINNAIHPGEPDGVDASMRFFWEQARDPDERLKNVAIVCIPFYNIGGALIRNSHSRANQEGPEEYGFRGNARNLDLNRDFIKCDSRNALSFAKLLRLLDPDVYLETHVSNGADYQYTMTYLPSQPDKLGHGMGRYMRQEMIPALEDGMQRVGHAMTPYVNVWGRALDSSYTGFYDSPRYSTGFAALHQIYGLLSETHMLKPFDQRVEATYQLIDQLSQFCADHADSIRESRKLARESVVRVQSFPLDWTVDSSQYRTLDFLGYAFGYKPSEVSGHDRLYYDRERPIQFPVRYYNHYKPLVERKKPTAYLLRAGYRDVVDRLLANGVPVEPLHEAQSRMVTSYRIVDTETVPNPFEGHYLHSNTVFEADSQQIFFQKGDLIIPMGYPTDRFVMEVLEPDAPDSYFNWNFFDVIFQQKEWYSPYVFEDKAAKLLAKDSTLRTAFLEQKSSGAFDTDPRAALYWIYTHSPHYEPSHMQLPVFRIEN